MTNTAQARGLVVTAVLIRRELVRFTRQPARIVAAIGTACVLWLFLASGFAEALRPQHLGDAGYATFLLPGMMTLVAVFAAVFSSLSIIEDRNDGWLATVLVSPVPRWAIAAGRITGAAAVAWAQAAVLLLLAPLLDVSLSVPSVLLSLAGLAVTCLGMTAVGVAFAWRTETTAGFHAVMNLVFAPLWMLSGSIFPVQGAAPWLARLTGLNPLTWCTQSIRGPLAGTPWSWSLISATAFAAAAVLVATWIVARPAKT
ncbi:MAG: ABC transporter permease [Planctomycetota bacterium]|jgi:ABC-2 type transport system permease protein